MRDILNGVRLTSKYKAGSTIPKRLYEAFGSLQEIYDAQRDDYLRLGFKINEVSPVLGKSRIYAASVCEYCAEKGIDIITYGDGVYPPYLYDLPDSPAVLFCKGTLPDFSENLYVAMVGTRKMSRSGALSAHRLSFEAASAGAVIISGFAKGIDSVCHRGAIDAGGKTVAVLGCGVDVIYPPENAALYRDIVKNGALISEYLPGTEPKAENFPPRNRLISGMARTVVVVEAPYGSGAEITANYAIQQGRKLRTVPSSVANASSGWSNSLLKKGISPVTDGYDILEEFEPMFPNTIEVSNIVPDEYFVPSSIAQYDDGMSMKTQKNDKSVFSVDRSEELQGEKRDIYEKLLKGPMSADEFVTDKRTLGDVLLVLAELEIDGYVSVSPGGLYQTAE